MLFGDAPSVEVGIDCPQCGGNPGCKRCDYRGSFCVQLTADEVDDEMLNHEDTLPRERDVVLAWREHVAYESRVHDIAKCTSYHEDEDGEDAA